MMKSRRKVKPQSKGKKIIMRQKKASTREPPLSAREVARVKESAQNIKEGKYKDFSSVDQMWSYAESEAAAASQ